MILNVSGRCDIVGFYTEWFMNRYREGYLDVRNPFYESQVSRIYFEDVDLILFCTKNPVPIVKYLKEITKPILFHVTITPYNRDIEPNVLDKKEVIKAVKEIAKIIGSDNVVIRYDSIFLSEKYNLDYHLKAFSKLLHLLKGSTKTVIVSFLDIYKNVIKNQNILKYQTLTEKDYETIGLTFSKIAHENGMVIKTCFEEHDLVTYGFEKGECLSSELAFKLTGKIYKKWTARKCNCVSMVDIGAYNSCNHLCKYCYANYDEKKVAHNMKLHNPQSSLLIGDLKSSDVIKRRKN